MHVVIYPERTIKCGGDWQVSAMLSHIEFRSNDPKSVEYESGWWRTSRQQIAEELAISERKVQTILANAVSMNAVIVEKHHIEGAWDQTNSYRVAHEFLLATVLADPLNSLGQCSSNESVQSSYTYEVSNNTLAVEQPVEAGAKTRRKTPPHVLPEDWQPTDKHRATAEKMGISEALLAETARKMRRWSVAGDKKRANWNATFNNFLANVEPDGVVRKSGSAALVEAESLMADGRHDLLPGLVGVEVHPPWGDDPLWMGHESDLEIRRLKSVWWSEWWEREGKTLL